jgi:bifunctional non-homologous end joining protein LigD
LWSRNGVDVTTKYAVLLAALQKIDGSCVIDGELCERPQQKSKATLCRFDALFVAGKDIREIPLVERKEILKGLLPRGSSAAQ